MKGPTCILILSATVILLNQSEGTCSGRCNGIETCEADGKDCATCDGTTDCALTIQAGYCAGCTCLTGCTDGSACNGVATGGAASCDECYYQTTTCVPKAELCDSDCLTCVEACDECETDLDCIFSETVDGRDCFCGCDDSDCEAGAGCTDDDFICVEASGACVCELRCNHDINPDACGGCDDPTTPICDLDAAGSACMCVPDCGAEADDCGSDGDCDLLGGTCVLTLDKHDCECVVLDCETCAPDCSAAEECSPNPEGTDCMCVPICSDTDCGTDSDACAHDEECVLLPTFDDCFCSPLPTDDVPTTAAAAGKGAVTASLLAVLFLAMFA